MKNKYQEALDFIIDHTHPMCETMKDLEALDFSYDILQELIDRATPIKPFLLVEHKKPKKRRYQCPRCGNACLVRYAPFERNENRHCSDCGQKLSWDNHEGVNNKAIDWSDEE